MVMPTPTPSAMASRRPSTLMAPPETSLALMATAITAGSTSTALKPIARANR